ncbi:heavy metal translocating P-type ATPase [Enterococcus phoeniculicola]|uniref:Cd(2+)-exporting ATPase n=1 Tax=Enterococcus phoeniculicola ATCC BAA-412 TaxID=1158610 RepID=R3WIE4_9ENTE|nr:heavy metal translocating P-type ATPase [Enterococcus phoeniculicola]EOL47601.1 heavy metal translocating P-type ATPase [Enterococcus phoeniculicola ATCC BAA-412]EOT72896.1 cadmium-translocating P-type ATPase [Enterococcus phoeniculicola ATCC BAA-412]OJG71389.1 heavy metal translocating P-type ATPase [Enterococcus phoeniculicola]
MGHFKKFIFTVAVGLLALITEFVLHQPTWSYLLVAIVGGIMAFSMLIEMIKTLKSGKYGVDILAITAIVATLAVGEYWASLMVLIMLTGGDSLEDYAGRQASKELRALLNNSPQIAHKLVEHALVDIEVEQVQINDTLVVKPGEIVPVDGRVIEGESTFDESSLTGESAPVEKKMGDELMSGSINGDRSVKVRVDKLAADSQYQTIIKLVKESEAKPAEFVRMADRYAVPFTLIAYLIGGISWIITKDPVRFAEVLVVASPCPLILAAPIALVAGMSRSSRNGIVVKTGTTLEKLAQAKSFAFDKTGTITKGQLSIDQIVPVAQFSEKEFLQYVASAEQDSSHILARSILNEAKGKVNFLPVTNLEEVTGSGIKATINQKEIKIGRAEFAGTIPNDTSQTIIYVSLDNQYIGYMTFKDVVRTESKQTLSALKELGVQNLVMLTGDQQEIAEEIAHQVGITNVYAHCLPQDKISVLKNTKKEERPIVMVGDGVNDAPALAVADIGIAMGAHGSTAASESADAVILKDDLTRVSTAVKVAQDTMKIARQSVLIGIFICVGLMLVASTGVIPALLGAALQEVVDTVSILSALRAKNDQ